MKKPVANPPKEDCRCHAFCVEDTERTGRVCRVVKDRADQRAEIEFESGNAAWAASFIA